MSVNRNRDLAAALLFGWILWFTQQELRPTGDVPMRWNLLGRFEEEAACEKAGEAFVGQLGRLSPERGYTRGTAWMSMIDMHQDRRRQLYTVMYCIAEDTDPRLAIPKGSRSN